ncbi:hypothetical protein KQX54_020495 [Cotesia glomerata]|uniref:Uncharacterized protein n=1 Tax=Cotesia glomerata TaxID=32391 RepID=A0AAV7HLZ7_COTGL|nr:hypothetical protein KQX54_020495 [Cotesia glomerata]
MEEAFEFFMTGESGIENKKFEHLPSVGITCLFPGLTVLVLVLVLLVSELSQVGARGTRFPCTSGRLLVFRRPLLLLFAPSPSFTLRITRTFTNSSSHASAAVIVRYCPFVVAEREE